MRYLDHFLVLACTVIVSNCASNANYASYGKDFDASLFSQFKNGVTTKTEVISAVGQPFTKTVVGNGETMLNWSFTHAIIHSKVELKNATAFFDKNDILLRVTVTESVR